MSRVVEHLAELTGFRDRDVLDVTLVGALKDLLVPASVAIYRCVGDAPAQRWLTRARLEAGQHTPTADPLWAPLESLPELAAHPLRHACLERQETLHSTDSPATAFFPLSTESAAIGVLEVASAQRLTAPQMQLVSSILRIYRNLQGLLDYSERDSLTGLLNRKTFDENFLRVAPPPVEAEGGESNRSFAPADVAARLRRQGIPGGAAWMGLIDIDHFKQVNDRFGHLIGDEVLLLLSRLMRSCFRFQDHLYRFGGEEFVVLMRCEQAAHAVAAFERLRDNVERYAFAQVGRMTVSIGLTAVRPDDSPQSAFERADRAVYHAKQNGRNRVCDHDQLVAAGQLAEAARSSDVELF
jgi:diguanylate cyclase (GGDEF)-like protein